MAVETDIQWTDTTANPTMGCQGCELWNKTEKRCYAGKITENKKGNSPGFPPSFDQVTLFPGRMEKAAKLPDLRGTKRLVAPWKKGLPRLIFVSDMSDALSKTVPFEYLENEIINVVESEAGLHHRWMWLTKRPERMAEFSQWLAKYDREWPPNLWAGTSLTTQSTTWRLDELLQVGDELTTRFVSFEPAWEEIDLNEWLPELDWMIHGGESGKEAKAFELDWARRLIDDCTEHNVPYFLKQLGRVVTNGGEEIRLKHSHGSDWREWPEDLRVREFPPVDLEVLV